MPLAQAFWVWAVGIALLVNATTSLLFLMLLTLGQTAAAFVAGYALSVPYNVVAAVGVWRSAARHPGPPGLAQAARLAATLWLALLSLL
jgi:hypothetical protein